MSTVPEIDYSFNFKFNLHKSIIPIGIDDHDYDRLKTVYGVSDEWMKQTVESISASNKEHAEILAKKFDFEQLNKKPLKIVFFGDSITSDRQSYFNIMKIALQNCQNVNLVDMSISAHKSTDLFTALYPNMVGEHADIAHIMIGTNDVRQMDDDQRLHHTGPEEYEKNVSYVVSELVKDGTKVIITTMPPYSTEKSSVCFAENRALFLEEGRQLYNGILARVAEKYNVFLNKMDERYAAYTPEELTLDDGIHLNAIGQDILAEGVVESILTLIK